MSKKGVKLPRGSFDSWLTKDEVAGALGVVQKTVDRLAIKGELQKAVRQRPRLPPIVVFSPADVERIKSEREQPFVMPNGRSGTSSTAVQSASQNSTNALVKALTAIADRVAAPPSELKEPFFLSLKQARATSGLPISYLREQLVNTGHAIKTGGGWRISRVQLEHLARTQDRVGQVANMSNMASVATAEGK